MEARSISVIVDESICPRGAVHLWYTRVRAQPPLHASQLVLPGVRLKVGRVAQGGKIGCRKY